MPGDKTPEIESSQNSTTAATKGFMDRWGGAIQNFNAGVIVGISTTNLIPMEWSRGQHETAIFTGVCTGIIVFANLMTNVARRHHEEQKLKPAQKEPTSE